MPVRQAVARYLPSALGDGRSARGVLGRVRRTLVAIARAAHRDDLAALLSHPVEQRAQHAKAVAQAIETLRTARPAEPQIADDIAQWFAPRAVLVLQAHGITTLADLTVRIPRRRQWWKAVPGLGMASARAIEAFFAAWPPGMFLSPANFLAGRISTCSMTLRPASCISSLMLVRMFWTRSSNGSSI